MKEASRVNFRCEVPITGGVCRWRGGHQFQAQRGSTPPNATPGTAKLECQMVRVLSHSSQWAEVPLGLLLRESPCPGVQTCGFGHSGLLLSAFLLYPIILVLT